MTNATSAYAASVTPADNTTINGVDSSGTTQSPTTLDNNDRSQSAHMARMLRDLGGANTVGGSADAITITSASGSIPAYFDGMPISFVAGNDNATTTPTANVDAVGAKVIKKALASTGAETALAAGDIQSGGLYLLRYRSAWASAGGAWQLIELNHAAPGGPEFIATIDLANDATADFTGFNSAKYDAYQFVLANVIPATDDAFLYVRTSTDGGSNYDAGAADYTYAVFSTTAEGVGGGNSNSTGGVTFIPLTRTNVAGGIGNAAGEDGWTGVVQVVGPHLAKKTQIIADGAYLDSAGQFRRVTAGGVRSSSADVDALRFLMSAGNLTSGTITMYGLKNA